MARSMFRPSSDHPDPLATLEGEDRMKKLLSLLIPGLAACAGHVEPDRHAPRVVQMEPWAQGMCGLFDDQQVRCWGYDAPHEVWNVRGLTGVTFAATDDSGREGRICAVSAAGTMACVIAECVAKATLDCTPKRLPYEVHITPRVVSASLDIWGGAALRADGTFQAWGSGVPECFDAPPYLTANGLNQSAYDRVITPQALARPIVALDHGGTNICFVTDDGRVYCTQAFLDGSLPTCAWPPAAVQEIGTTTDVQDATAVTASSYLVCILHQTGHVSCYGEELLLGCGGTSNEFTHAEVSTIDDAVAIAGSSIATCVIRSDGSLWCWGDDMEGMLGVEPMPDSFDEVGLPVYPQVPSPRRVEGLTDVQVIGMSDGYVCASEADGDIWCWGWPTGPTPYRIVVPPAE